MRLIILFLLLAVSCSRSHTLSTKGHQFGKKAKHIVWILVDGLEEEHIALSKFSRDSVRDLTPFEKMTCTGSMWDYNLFELRPSSLQSFMGQIIGSQKITGKCSDIDRPAVWSYFQDSGYQVGIMEGLGPKKDSLLNYYSCDNEQNIFKNAFFWSLSKKTGDSDLFHYQEKMNLEKPDLYFDKSCQNKGCFVDLKTNVTKVWSAYKKSFSKTFFVVRQSDFKSKLLKKNIKGARESLQEIINILNFFIPKAKSGEVSLVLTSGSTRSLEFPRSGKQWSEFEKKGSKVIYRRSNLLAKAWSIGPGAENFCGTYESSDILRRFIWTPEEDVFYFSF